jgi:DEAD/DEAH box helicase domain-containing protein
MTIPIEQLLEALRGDSTIAPHITAWRTLEPRPAHYAPTPDGLDLRLQSALDELGITRLYTHQSSTIAAVWRQENVVVATGTASGKSLCYHLPVLHTLLEDPAATALYLFPTKALAHDQEAALSALVSRAVKECASDETPSAPMPESYDGDTPSSARSRIRQHARIILSNPDMLHAGILPRHPHWERFLRGLRYIVLDEVHTYRGLFGSHVANVLRRLKRICAFYGSQPRFLCASATIANPGELAEHLLEAPVTVIDDDGSPRGRMHVLLYNPPLLDPALGLRQSLLLESQRLATVFLQADLQTVVFARSRRGMELLLTYLRRDVSPRARHTLRGYRGGYLPALRREIEAGLREGKVRGVVATNALELGVDIGSLAACVMAGYPGTIASTWQQAGRAGRRDQAAIAVLVTGPGPLDQYLATHPDYFFGRSPEHARINPNNPLLLAAHLRCAAFELAFDEDEPFGNTAVGPYLDFLAEEGWLLKEKGHYFWIGSGSPAREVSLRTASSDPITIVDPSGERPRTVGQVDRPSAPLMVHQGAIYLHEGRLYQVRQLDWEGGIAHVRPAQVDHYTQAHLRVDWEVILEAAVASLGEGTRHQGDVRVQSQATTYRRVRLYTHENLGWGHIDLPPQEFITQAFWMTLPWMAQKILLPDYGPTWAEQRRRARERDQLTCQHCGAHEAVTGREHDVHHIKPFRSFGYVPGENDAYLQANELGNLLTLCRVCHARVDHGPREGTVAALQGLGHVLRHVAPLFLLCDVRDIRVSTRLRALPEGLPVVLIYDDCPGGAGLSPYLFECTDDLLQAALERVEECPCYSGCPSCVGPIEEGEGVVKERVEQVLRLLS